MINVGKTIINHPQITIFIGGMVTIPSHGWFIIVFPTLYHMIISYDFVMSPFFADYIMYLKKHHMFI